MGIRTAGAKGPYTGVIVGGGGGGSVESVSGASPIISSGGATPVISLGDITNRVMAALGYDPYDPLYAYSQNESCHVGGVVYVSSVAGTASNTGNTPGPTSDAFWGRYPKALNGISKFTFDTIFG